MAGDVRPPPLTARDLVHWAAFVRHLEGKVGVDAGALEACRGVCERRFAEICRGMGAVEDALKWDRAGPPLARGARVYGAAPFALEALGNYEEDAFCDDAPT